MIEENNAGDITGIEIDDEEWFETVHVKVWEELVEETMMAQ